MNRVRILGFLAGALTVLALAVPVPALAGTYTWNLASDFTAASPGANPDHDQYGATPWSYQVSSNGTIAPSTFSPFTTFSTNVGTPPGLSTWTLGSPSAPPRIGINPTGNQISDGNATVAPQQVFLEPASGGVVAVGWTSPFSQTEIVSIDVSLSAAVNGMTPPCVYGATWNVIDQNGNPPVDQNGNPLPGTTSTSSGSFSAPSVSVVAGGSIFVTVAPTSALNCAPTALSLQIQATGTPPAVTLTSPASGSSSTVNKPTFSGAAGTNFGDGSQVTLRIYSGTSVSGTPVQTVTVPRSGAGWSAALGSVLPLGTYTAQAEQDNISSPPDAGLSAPVTFSVTVPAVSLDSLGSGPLTTSTPTFTGTADTDAGSLGFVVVEVFPGSTATGSPLLALTAARSASGQYSVPVPAPSALADGTYTALAEQGDVAGNAGYSATQSFSVDTQAPPVTLVSPGAGSRFDVLHLVFTGAAGGQSFDSAVVNVSVYRGKKAVGKPVGSLQATVKGSTWSVTWPGQVLRRGSYTALASQTDAVGHRGLSPARTFQIVPLPPVIGSPVTINRRGTVSLKMSCNEPAGDTCAGTVRVLTTGAFQTVLGGPSGPLTVMFAYVHILGGHTSTITRQALASVAAVLRRHAKVAVAISATLHPRSGTAIHATARIKLRRT